MVKFARVSLAISTEEIYPLSAFPYLDRPERLLRVLHPGVRGGRVKDADWRGWSLVVNGSTPTLEFTTPYDQATGSLTLEVMRPLFNWIGVGGTEAASTVGLQSDTDTVDVSVEDLLPEALAVAYETLAARTPAQPFPQATELAAFWQGEARRGQYHDASQDRQAPAAQGQAA